MGTAFWPNHIPGITMLVAVRPLNYDQWIFSGYTNGVFNRMIICEVL